MDFTAVEQNAADLQFQTFPATAVEIEVGSIFTSTVRYCRDSCAD